MKASKTIILIWAVMAGLCKVGYCEEPPKAALSSESEAIARALAYTGFDKTEGFSDKAVSCEEIQGPFTDKTPLVHDKIAGQSVWKVTYSDILVGRGDRFVGRNFEVLLDKTSGKLLSIYSVSDKAGSADTLPEPDADAAEDYLQNVSFLSIPDLTPEVPFAEALNALTDNPARVKIIRAMYCNYKVTNMNDSTKYAIRENNWIIITRGSETIIPLAGKPSTPVPNSLLNSLWSVIDAKTGRLLLFTNAPQDPEIVKSVYK